MPRYDVWMEGYSCTGQHCPDEYMGSYSAEDFESACLEAMRNHGYREEDIKRYYNKEHNTYYGCKFYEYNPHRFY